MTDVSIGVVAYNNYDDILEMFKSVEANSGGLSLSLFMVDNSPSDQTADRIEKELPEVRVIRNSENLGFGRAHNQLINVIDSKYHIIINPDIVISSDVISELKSYMDAHPEAVLITPKILNPDMSEQFLPKRRPTLTRMVGGRLAKLGGPFRKIRDDYTRKNEHFGSPAEIEFCTGCFMFFRTEIFKKTGGFDEGFFMYLEDAELTERAAEHGKVIFYPDASVIHKWNGASRKSLRHLLIHIRSMLYYLKLSGRKKSTSRKNAA